MNAATLIVRSDQKPTADNNGDGDRRDDSLSTTTNISYHQKHESMMMNPSQQVIGITVDSSDTARTIDNSCRLNESLNCTLVLDQSSPLAANRRNHHESQNCCQPMESFDELLKRHCTDDYQPETAGTFQPTSDGNQDPMQSTVRFFSGDETSTLA